MNDWNRALFIVLALTMGALVAGAIMLFLSGEWKGATLLAFASLAVFPVTLWLT